MIQKNKNLLGLRSTEIRNRISGANSRKRSPLETRLILKRWSKSQEGKMAQKLWESKQFLKSIGK